MDGTPKEEKVLCLSGTGETAEKMCFLGKILKGIHIYFLMKCNSLWVTEVKGEYGGSLDLY